MRKIVSVSLRLIAALLFLAIVIVGIAAIWYSSTLRDYRLEGDATTLELPADFPMPEVTVYGDPTPGTLYMEAQWAQGAWDTLNAPYAPYIFEFDIASGQVAYARKVALGAFNFQRHDADTMSYYTYDFIDYALMSYGVWGGAHTGIDGGYFHVLDNDYNIVDTISLPDGVDLHELIILENGNYVYLATDWYWEAEPDADCAAQCAVVTQKVIEETPAGEIVWEWDLYDHYNYPIDEMRRPLNWYFDALPQQVHMVDITHANSIDIDDAGNLILSLRQFDEVVKVDRQTGDIIWHMGGPSSLDNQFTFIDDPLNGFSHQHHAQWLDNGNLLVFDNGNMHEGYDASRVVEYEVDEENMTATLVWSYETEARAYAPNRGSAVRLANGNTIINWVDNRPNVQEVTPEGEIVWEMTLPENYGSYRAAYWSPKQE